MRGVLEHLVRHARDVDRVDDIGELMRLAAKTDGCLTVHQIRECGYTKTEISTLVRRGILHRPLVGIYVIGATMLSHAQAIRVALLAVGSTAHVSGRTALELRGAVAHHRGGRFWIGVIGGQRRPIRITLMPLSSTGRPAMIHFVRVGRTAPIESHRGLPIAAVPRALIDAAARESSSMLKRIVREMDFLRLLEERPLSDELDRRRHGSRALRGALPAGPLTAALAGSPDSRAAHRFVRGLLARGVTPTSVDQPLRVGGRELRPDVWHAREKVVFEADGPQHDLPERRAEDEARDAHLADQGIATMRFKTSRIRRELERCLDEAMALLIRRAPA